MFTAFLLVVVANLFVLGFIAVIRPWGLAYMLRGPRSNAAALIRLAGASLIAIPAVVYALVTRKLDESRSRSILLDKWSNERK